MPPPEFVHKIAPPMRMIQEEVRPEAVVTRDVCHRNRQMQHSRVWQRLFCLFEARAEKIPFSPAGNRIFPVPAERISVFRRVMKAPSNLYPALFPHQNKERN
jgi:hypothetical protein